jgi:5-methylcytosine-specific restriction endonuclease McrA
VKWAEWLTLPIREGDNIVRTVQGHVRVPTVLVLASFAKVPVKRPKLSARTIWQRDGGVCQYTGQALAPDQGNIDHVLPRSRGGKTSWENCVLAHKEVNSRKADKLPEEVGLTLRRRPAPPRELPVTLSIRNHHGVRDWERFLARRG